VKFRPSPVVVSFFFLVFSSFALGRLFAGDYKTVRLFGTDYVDAREFAGRFGLTPRWISTGKTLRLQSKWTKLDLTVDQLDVTLNGLQLYLSEPVVAHPSSLYLAEGDIETLLTPILRPSAKKPIPRLKTIVIDAGHGGHDPGNQNRRLKLKEKQMTLDVARRLARLLRAAGFRVYETRRRDRYVDIDDRTALVRKHHADLFISIHFNAFSDPSVGGTETYVMTPRRQPSSPQRERDRHMMSTAYPGNRHDHWNVLAGYRLHRHLVESLGLRDRGLKRFRYRVLREADCPAVLVEAAFLSNDAEARQVSHASYRQKIATALAAGVKAHAAALRRLR
jgi:N-acetylmuramoyl-L-alanine amidase